MKLCNEVLGLLEKKVFSLRVGLKDFDKAIKILSARKPRIRYSIPDMGVFQFSSKEDGEDAATSLEINNIKVESTKGFGKF